MIRRVVTRSIQAGRPPRPKRVIHAADVPDNDPIVTLATGETVEQAIGRVDLEARERTLLIFDGRRDGRPGIKTTNAVAKLVVGRSAITIGLPSSTSAVELQHWRQRSNAFDGEVSVLGSGGWDRVVFGDRTLVLEHADVPANLRGEQSILVISEPGHSGCLGLWSDVVHPNTALRVRVSPQADVELASAFNATYLLISSVGSVWVAGVTDVPIVAELLARGIERTRERLRGIEAPGPWEDSGIQHLSQIEHNALIGSKLVLRVRLRDATNYQVVGTMHELLGGTLDIVEDGIGEGNDLR